MRLAFTQENEEFVRDELFEFWSVYYARRRWEMLSDLRDIDPTSLEARKIRHSRFYKSPAPVDLSGACKLAAQTAFAIFDLDGQVVSNRVHTFVEMSQGDLYDINRDCNDVVTLQAEESEPHVILPRYTRSERARSGRESWNATLKSLVADLGRRALKAHCEVHRGKPIVWLPRWALIPEKPRTTIKEIGLVKRSL